MKHPMQTLEKDEHGVLRFRANAIVEHLLKVGRKNGCGLNEIACMQFSIDDRRQFAQLIGYSLCGYGELGYVDDDTYAVAERMVKDAVSEDEARLKHLEEELGAVRKSLRDPIARLFGVHPDDLGKNL